MMMLFSLPVWLAGIMALLLGLIGTFSPRIRGTKALVYVLIVLPSSAGFFVVASKMCGLL